MRSAFKTIGSGLLTVAFGSAPIALAQQTPAPAQLPAGTTAAPEVQPAAPAQTQSANPVPLNGADCASQGRVLQFEHDGPSERFWVAGGPVLWWIKDAPATVLATTDGQQLVGGIDFGTFSGLALNTGMWLNCRHTFGLELGGFILEERSDVAGFASDANGNPTITRPIFDVQNLRTVNVLVSAPGSFAGGILRDATSRLAGANAGFLANVAHSCDWSFDAVFGFRYLDLDEELNVTQATRALPQGALSIAGTPVAALAVTDSFRTRNQFYGGQIGVRGEYRFGVAFANFRSTVALGPNHEVIDIVGQTSEIGGAGLTVPGGLLAAGQSGTLIGGNMGRQITNRFTVVPEVAGQLGVQLFDRYRAWIGYNFLYMSDTARPGGQIDTNINPRVVPISQAFGTLSGPPSPRPTLLRNDFVAHGVQFGLEFRY